MQVMVESRAAGRTGTDVLAVPLFQLDPARWHLSPRHAQLDRSLGGRIAAALASGDFKGKRGDTLLIYPPPGGAVKRVLLVGLGEEAKLDAEALRRAAGSAVQAAAARRGSRVAFLVPSQRRVRVPAAAQALAEGAVLAGYRFDSFRTRREDAPSSVSSFELLFEKHDDARAARLAAAHGVVIAESQNVARDLSNQPANELRPLALARAAQKVAKEVGLASRVLGPAELRRRKMGGLLAVGQGSDDPPQLIVLEHNRPPRAPRSARARKQPTLCLVGKGITFDSGGISIKPGAGMHEMKHDMSGGAAVIGALRAAALLRLPLHVVGIVPAAENMPSGSAYRPGDVVRAMSGRTIEILNTDAEGRVILADALHFAHTDFEPEAIVDLATLTGACVIALGKWSSAVLANDEGLRERIRRSGEATGERAWPLPLWEEHREHVRGDVADIKNTGGREGGALTAAAFLSYFTEGVPWAHVDIAGTAYTEKPGPYQPRGATGVGVRLLVDLLRGWRDGSEV